MMGGCALNVQVARLPSLGGSRFAQLQGLRMLLRMNRVRTGFYMLSCDTLRLWSVLYFAVCENCLWSYFVFMRQRFVAQAFGC